MGPLKFHRAWTLTGYGLVVLVVVLSLTPSPPPPVGIPGLDKFFHLLAYAVLMLWFAQLHPRSRYAVLVCCFIALGILLEMMQSQLGIRVKDVWDAVANGLGAILSWGLALNGMNTLFHKFEEWCLKPGKEN